MKAIQIVNQIKDVLGIELSETEVKLETMKLENGTSIESLEFAPENEVFIISEDEQKISLPIGEYTLETGQLLTVTEEGIIAEIKDATEEAPVEQEVEEEVEANESATAPVKSTETTQKVVYATKEEVSELKSMIESLMEKKELSEEVKDVELTAEVVEPITHNPEAASEPQSNLPRKTNSKINRIREMIYINK
jgi:hypothetical protein|tara:strand:- start:442 stop:1023 length:582 start_codon:yes stop_codon:yes gene_type:complete